jgi:Fn3 associated
MPRLTRPFVRPFVRRRTIFVASLAVLCVVLVASPARVEAAEKRPVATVIDGVRFLPAPKHEAMLVGGKFAGSNQSPTSGFVVLGEIKEQPKASEWTVLHFDNQRPYRWIRFELVHAIGNNVAQFEYLSGSRRVGGLRFYDAGLGEYVGVDLREQASTQPVRFSANTSQNRPTGTVTLRSRTPGATITYTVDGTTPTSPGTDGEAKVVFSGRQTISAVAFSKDLAPSPVAHVTYMNGNKPVTLKTFHVGNSLTGNAVRFRDFAPTAGINNVSAWFLIGGAYTVKLWNAKETFDKERFEREYARAAFPLDQFTLQPRDFEIDEEVANEQNWIHFIREKSPDVQPWLYAEWVERERRRPSDRGTVPSYQMKKLYPAATWQESMSAMLLYVEEVQHRLHKRLKEGKPARILPCSLALGFARNLIDEEQLPGVPAAPSHEVSFYRLFFEDSVHVNPNGCYLVDLIWYAAFTGQSPEHKFLPVGTTLTPGQAEVLQRLAWRIVESYPDCGIYHEGTTPAAVPQFSVPPGPIEKPTPIHLTSATPDVFYRYTLDGTTPTRTRGYVSCGVVTAQPGMTIKAVAYKSGFADSGVAEASYPASK